MAAKVSSIFYNSNSGYIFFTGIFFEPLALTKQGDLNRKSPDKIRFPNNNNRHGKTPVKTGVINDYLQYESLKISYDFTNISKITKPTKKVDY